MAMQTFYVVQQFVKHGRQLSQGQAFKVSDKEQALRKLEKEISKPIVGMVAFSQEHDPETEEFGVAHILGKVGEVPPEVMES